MHALKIDACINIVENMKALTSQILTACGKIAYCLWGYFYLGHPPYVTLSLMLALFWLCSAGDCEELVDQHEGCAEVFLWI